MTLEKNLPISSGMGGGSSNAATVIRAIHDIFEVDESQYLDAVKQAGPGRFGEGDDRLEYSSYG